MKHIALGVNIGNLGRGKRPREPMVSRCDRINRSLAREGVDLRVVGFYRHTGNLVLETVALHPMEAANFLSEADGATWMAVPEETMRKAVEKVRKIPPPEDEEGVRWTPGLAFAVTKPGERQHRLIGQSSPPVNRHGHGRGVEAGSNHRARTT
jgi:hypothetical protein